MLMIYIKEEGLLAVVFKNIRKKKDQLKHTETKEKYTRKEKICSFLYYLVTDNPFFNISGLRC
jgi:hypothetical protein